jgi:ribosomal protein S18 acetylase RimI-like enzyme
MRRMPRSRRRLATAPATHAIRTARLADLPALVALEQRCFALDRLSPRQYRRHVASAQAWVGIARAGDEAAGSAVVFLRRDGRAGRLYSIAVAPASRGTGLGAALLAAAERAARRHGARTMRLEVRPDNRRAIALYVARGYRPIGRRPRYYEDGADALRFEKSLARGQ